MVSPSESQAPVYCQMAKYSQDVLCLHSHAYLGFHPSFWGRLEDLLALRTSCLGCILKSLAKAFLILCIYILYIYMFVYLCIWQFSFCPMSARFRKTKTSVLKWLPRLPLGRLVAGLWHADMTSEKKCHKKSPKTSANCGDQRRQNLTESQVMSSFW